MSKPDQETLDEIEAAYWTYSSMAQSHWDKLIDAQQEVKYRQRKFDQYKKSMGTLSKYLDSVNHRWGER